MNFWFSITKDACTYAFSSLACHYSNDRLDVARARHLPFHNSSVFFFDSSISIVSIFRRQLSLSFLIHNNLILIHWRKRLEKDSSNRCSRRKKIIMWDMIAFINFAKKSNFFIFRICFHSFWFIAWKKINWISIFSMIAQQSRRNRIVMNRCLVIKSHVHLVFVFLWFSSFVLKKNTQIFIWENFYCQEEKKSSNSR